MTEDEIRWHHQSLERVRVNLLDEHDRSAHAWEAWGRKELDMIE